MYHDSLRQARPVLLNTLDVSIRSREDYEARQLPYHLGGYGFQNNAESNTQRAVRLFSLKSVQQKSEAGPSGPPE